MSKCIVLSDDVSIKLALAIISLTTDLECLLAEYEIECRKDNAVSTMGIRIKINRIACQLNKLTAELKEECV